MKFVEALRNNENKAKTNEFAEGVVENLICHFPGKKLSIKNFHVNKKLIDDKMWWINQKIGESETIDPNVTSLPIRKSEIGTWLQLCILMCKGVMPTLEEWHIFRKDEKQLISAQKMSKGRWKFIYDNFNVSKKFVVEEIISKLSTTTDNRLPQSDIDRAPNK
jgi:hypothetical protein